jgi:ATP synthase protein I
MSGTARNAGYRFGRGRYEDNMRAFRIHPHPVTGPTRERPGEEQPASLADVYRKAEPYMAASSTLVASVIGFTALGYWLDRRMGHSVQWLLLVGAVVGMVVGFVSFFRKVLGTRERR